MGVSKLHRTQTLCISSFDINKWLHTRIHTIAQLINTIFRLHLCRWVKVSYSIKNKYGDCTGKESFRTSCKICWVVWASYELVLSRWNRILRFYCKKDCRRSRKIFSTYMALFKVPFTSTKQLNEIWVKWLLQSKTHLNMSLPKSTLFRPMTLNKKTKSAPVRVPVNPSADPLANFQKLISVFTRSRWQCT